MLKRLSIILLLLAALPLHAAPRAGEVHRIALDVSKARRWLAWSPQTSLMDGLRKTAEWLQSTR